MAAAGATPLSAGQRAQWLLHEIDPASPAYNVHLSLKVHSEIDAGALRRAFQRIVDRHAPLRSTFRTFDGEPYQIAAIGAPVRFDEIDARGSNEEAVMRAAREAAHRPFDLATGPVFRVRLFTRAAHQHVLLISAHHIVTDMWSTLVIMDELGRIYPAERAGLPAELQPLPLQYLDFVRWQEEMLAGAEGTGHERHWRAALAGDLPDLELATDRPRGAARSSAGETHRFRVEPELAGRLHQVARSERATLFTILLAAFQALLHRETGQSDIIVGTPAAARTRAEFESLVGYFVNPLPMRADFSGDPTFREHLRRAHGTVIGALEHQDFPFPTMVERFRPRRDPSRSPVFQSMFSFERPHRAEARGSAAFVFGEDGTRRTLGDLDIEPFILDVEGAQFELTLAVHESGGGLNAAFEFNSALFRRESIERLTARFLAILEAITTDPSVRISGIRQFPEDERRRILQIWSGASSAPAGAEAVTLAIARAARRRPSAPAITCGAETVTFGELSARVAALGRRLREAGIGPGAVVGLLAGRSPHTIAGMLAVLESGAAYLPLDPALPPHRLAALRADASPALVLTLRSLWRPPASDTMPVLMLDELPESWPGEAGDPPGNPHPEDPASIIYTSGTSGTPRGVVIPHRALSNHAAAIAEAYGLGPADRVLQFASPAFDVAAEEIFPTLASGATIVLRPEGDVPGFEEFDLFLARERVTVLNVPASYWHAWVRDADRSGRALAPDLRLVVTGSERVPPSGIAPWRRIARGRARLVNAYGPTETTITATLHAADESPSRPGAGFELEDASVPIGRPLPGVRVHALDSRGQTVGIGTPGEAVIGGVGVALGYLGRPDLTAERFVPDPHATEPGQRCYRSGDRVRWRPNGDLDFLGRIDDQIKVRGFRIEPAEIEQALRAHPDVAEAAVVARADEAGRSRLSAHLEPRRPGGVRPPAGELSGFLASRLPEYMVPADYAWTEALPRTAGGKIDRRALALRAPAGRADAEPEGPRTAAERALAAIWADLLGVREVGVHENFFSLGGDSILALQVVARARERGLRISSRQFFHHPTVATLAADAGEALPAPQVDQAEPDGEIPLTPIQRWFFELGSPEPHHDNQAVLLRLTAPPDVAALTGALDALAHRHDALRLRFERGAGGWRQRVEPAPGTIPLEVHDASVLPAGGCARAMEEISARVHASLDLASGPIARAALVDPGAAGEARLLLVVHHLAVDGVSWRILLEDLSIAYKQLREGGRVDLPPRTMSFARRARRLEEHARAGGVREERAYWSPPLAGMSAPLFPPDAGQEASSRTWTVRLPAEETRALLQAGRGGRSAGIQECMLAALARALARWNGPGLRLVDLEGHGRFSFRDDEDLSRTVGWFTALFPVLLDIGDPASPPEEALGRAREALRAIPRDGIGYGMLRYLGGDAGVASLLEAAPRAEICFNYLGQFDGALAAGGPFAFDDEPLGAFRSPRAMRSHALEINALVSDGSLSVAWTYSDSPAARAKVEELAATFLDALRELTGPLDERAAAYPLSPMQQGMLFHTLRDGSRGAYVEQMSWTFEGPLDEAALEEAWDRLAARHPALRTAVLWEGRETPLQVTAPAVTLPWERIDWRHLDAREQARRTERHLLAEREKGFDLARAPLMRFGLLRLGDERRHFVWTHHHIILDGWSVPILLEELAAIYAALREGRLPALPAARPYRDYIDWLASCDPAESESHWRRELAGLRAPTRPFVEGPRPSDGCETIDTERLDASWTRLRRALSQAATSALARFARAHGLTMGTLVSAAWGLLLSRYAGDDDVVFGTVLSGRPPELAGAESMVGLFINTLPLRLRVSPGTPLLAWLEEVQRRQFELLRRQHVPLSDVQRWSDVPRGQPLFESIVVFENYPAGPDFGSRLAGLEVRDLVAWDKTTYPITLAAAPGESLALQVVYAAERFAAPAMARMMDHLTTLLQDLPGDGERPLRALSMLPDAERERVLVEWNRPESEGPDRPPSYRYPRRSVHALFAERAARRSGAVAVRSGGRSLTYGELDRAAGRLADRLVSLGAGNESPIGICVERSPEMLIGMLAALKAGGSYLPLDPAYPPARISYMLRDSGARHVLATRSTAPLISGDDARTLLLDERSADGPAGVAGGPPAESSPPAHDPALDSAVSVPTRADRLACVMYTSGSTGEPKGVEVSHRGLVRMARDTNWARLDENDVVLQLVSPAFDPSAAEIWGCLLNGGTLVLHPSAKPSLEEIGDVLREHRVTMAILITGLFPPMVDERPDDLQGLRQLVVGGDVMPAVAARRVLEAVPGLRLVNAYGPTEGTVVATAHAMNDPREIGPTVPIGRPVANTRVYLLDGSGRPAPVGIAGEIFIGGDGVARGYRGRPDATADRFVPDPYGSPGSRLYRTGDLARWRGDGRIEFLGRADAQVKVRGFRIEPGEVEAVLGAHPDVRECAVVARRDARQELRLVAYVAATGGDPDSIGRWREHLRERLPEFMMPAAFVILERLPLSPNGKVDRAALPDPTATRPAGAAPPVAPQTPIEEDVAGIWADLLPAAPAGIDDDFFESGGHSLLATRVISRLRARLGPVVELRDLYDAPTIRGLAGRIESALLGSAAAAGVPDPVPPAPGEPAPVPRAPRPENGVERGSA
ncbi:MAG: amino acid adenylation domain-containing protein [Acidobacteria bacterium]|nr:amino acid adenylation domain-containing protein [Acidobacteriota bacterium]